MDDRDCRLLIELMRQPFASMEALGRQAGVSGKTAATRLQRLREAGILQGMVCGPAPQVLGTTSSLAVFLERPVACDVSEFLALAGVFWVAKTYPRATSILYYGAAQEGLAGLAGRKPDMTMHIGTAAPVELSPLDWRVMRAVMDDPRGELATQARAAGLTPRTVKARRDQLLASGALVAFPALDASHEEGAILYGAYLRVTEPADLAGLDVQDAWRMNTHDNPPATYLYGFVRTYAETRAIEARLRGMAGAQELQFMVPQGTWVATPHVRAWVDERIAFWASGRTPSAKAVRT